MQTKQVVELLKKYMSGTLTATESDELSYWVQLSEENAILFRQLTDPDYLSTQLCRFESVDEELNWEKLSGLQKVANGDQQPVLRVYPKWMWAAAAAVILLLSSLWTLTGDTSIFHTKNAMLATRAGEKQTFRLPDGTQVVLNSGSQLEMTEGFNDSNREVRLAGEAWFDIAPQKSLPFMIHTNTMQLRVLGTAFNVRAYPEEKAEVTSLIRGRLEVIIPKQNDGSAALRYILVPYQKMTVQKPADSITQPAQHTYINNTIAQGIQIDSLKKNQPGNITEIAWMENQLIFDNEPMSMVASKIEKWYGIKVIIETPELASISCTGNFDTEPLDKVLESMQFSIPALKFRKTADNTVLILYK